jgi:mannitol-specific phosphotransferase system IIBC component
MKHAIIFAVFFLIFTLASVLVAVPLFPGSLFLLLLLSENELTEYRMYIAALINGLVYSFLVGSFFVWLSKKLVED